MDSPDLPRSSTVPNLHVKRGGMSGIAAFYESGQVHPARRGSLRFAALAVATFGDDDDIF